MRNENILALLNKAIAAGEKGSHELSDIFDDLDLSLQTEGKEAVLRHYFDCWADAINHDYMVYRTKEPGEWVDAAIELKNWYFSENQILSERNLWKESLPKNF